MDTLTLTGNEQRRLTVGGVAAQTPELEAGTYDVWSDTDVFIKTAANASGVTILNGYLVRAGSTIPAIRIQDGHKIGAITSGAVGTLSFHKVS